MPLSVKVIGLTAVAPAAATVEVVLELGGRPAHAVAIAVLVAGYVLTAALAIPVVRRIRRGTTAAVDRLDAINTAARGTLVRGLEAMAAGDLTVELHPSTQPDPNVGHDEIGEILRHTELFRDSILVCYEAYNATAQRLREIVGRVSATAGTVGSASREMATSSDQAGQATGEIAHAISDVAHGAERQARGAEDALRTADEIAAAAAQSAQSAEETVAVAGDAQVAMRQGEQAAEQASRAMQSIQESSRAATTAIGELAGKSEEIGTIVHTISGIAEQTNLLALNAAIEAARAGEQGRGFAVVAEEVRTLAEDSQRATREIAALITAMQAQTSAAVAVVGDGARLTEEGANVVAQTRVAFVDIGRAVQDITARITGIAAASREIDAGASGVRHHVGEVAAVAEQASATTEQVSASTQETAASAQEIAATAHELAGTADVLTALVAQFTLRGGDLSGDAPA
ncbi:MAG: methyl-accepting chemotaxis protein [Solirubrobacteraceae bacterium]|jgi:methyl-accepting chemotaxis protein